MSDCPLRVDLGVRDRLFAGKQGLAVVNRYTRSGRDLEGDDGEDSDEAD